MADENNPADGGTSGDAAPQGDALTFDALYASLPESHRALFDEHVHGLKSTMERTKTEAKEYREAMKALRDSKDQDVNAVRNELGQKLAETERRAKFLETCPRDIGNPAVALTVAREFGAMADDGSLDADKLREVAPELFTKPSTTPASNAGKTNGSAAPNAFNMNDWIRRQAGVKV